ncbi:hypothetical protein NP92_02960 [Anoxybacillus gonensis]|uniref:Phage-Barnase-EndoU-ColicinE5/D-RelE like nuclease 2 domain-containing protein n=1 Tax=Anoxybacillus gonensis TaxID=198467 RepID=A0AAW7TDB3_9BACL|nr:hypothetical protein [Anoxybacillus gonensis]AKS37432.1 hypothetical protein AFK25_02530 [Anoxybacillus gonensis]KGP61369.1 hypothetical protein NP92_02960 [Anoxybacillus gonensis]MDO0876758.1 hypothetical protein [Anoxybacillus gonensis]
MNYGKLSQPLILTGNTIIDKIINLELIFSNLFMDKDKRPLYRGKFIFFDMNKLYKGMQLMFPERFMHICSIEDKPAYTIFPCNNDIAYYLCQNKCVNTNALTDFQKINRSECPYRMSRIHWIPEVIQLANNSDPDITTWTKPEKDNNGNRIYKHYIRYESGTVDYVVILKEERKKGQVYMYKFMTGFPVFTKRNKIQFEKDYQKYANKKGATHSTRSK